MPKAWSGKPRETSIPFCNNAHPARRSASDSNPSVLANVSPMQQRALARTAAGLSRRGLASSASARRRRGQTEAWRLRFQGRSLPYHCEIVCGSTKSRTACHPPSSWDWSCPALTDRFAKSIMSIAKELVDRDWLVTARAQATYADPAHETAALAALFTQ